MPRPAGPSRIVDEHTHAYYLQIAQFASPKGTIECVTAFVKTDFRDDIAKIDVPTLIIHGDSDLIVPFEISGRRTHATVQGSELVVLENAPHGAPFTHFTQWNDAVLKFLKSTPNMGTRNIPTNEVLAASTRNDPGHFAGIVSCAMEPRHHPKRSARRFNS